MIWLVRPVAYLMMTEVITGRGKLKYSEENLSWSHFVHNMASYSEGST